MPETQKDAPGLYGTHFKDLLPFEKFEGPVSEYFQIVNDSSGKNIAILDAAGGNGKRYGNGLLYLAGKPERSITYTVTDLMPDALEEFKKDVAPRLPEIISANTVQANLAKRWQFKDASFDASMMTWALHWFGRNHKHGIKELVRVMKPGAVGLLTTLTPYDVLLKNQIFPQSVPIEELRKLYPQADDILEGVSSGNGSPIWKVRLDTEISKKLKRNPDFVYIHKPSNSVLGKRTLVGFQPDYLPRVLEEEGCEVLRRDNTKNTNFPNEYSSGPRENTLLYYVFKKR